MKRMAVCLTWWLLVSKMGGVPMASEAACMKALNDYSMRLNWVVCLNDQTGELKEQK
jgi:hypothetical protein